MDQTVVGAPGRHPAPPSSDDHLRRRYCADGFVAVPGALDADTVAVAAADLVAVRRELGVREPAALVAVPLPHPAAARLAGHPVVAATASLLLGSPVAAFAVTWVVLAPGGPGAAWHQDGEPWARQHGVHDAVTAWIALDDAGPAGGCLRALPGSHRHGPARPLVPAGPGAGPFGVALDPAVAPALLGTTAPVDLPVRAGDVTFHDPALVHGSHPNRGERPRRAVAVRYRPALPLSAATRRPPR